MFVCCECCVLSGRSLCDELITRPEKSYRLWCVVVCDLETSRMRRPWPAVGSQRHSKKKIILMCLNTSRLRLQTPKILNTKFDLYSHRKLSSMCSNPYRTICFKTRSLYRVIKNDCRGFNLVLQMQPHVISSYGVTSRIRFMFLLFP